MAIIRQTPPIIPKPRRKRGPFRPPPPRQGYPGGRPTRTPPPRPGQSPPIIQQPPRPGGGPRGGPRGGPPAGGGGGTDPQTGLPLDPFFEAGRRSLDDVLASQLGGIAPGREQLLAGERLQQARLGTNEGVDRRSLLESLNARGAYGGGIQNRDMGRLGTDYLRQRQDLANTTAGGFAGFASQEAEARANYQRGLQELLLQLAQRQAVSPYAVTPR